MTDISNVSFGKYSGGGNITSWIASACAQAGVPQNSYWLDGMKTLCQRESSFNPNAVNTWDTNATGPTVSDGHPQNCSRGVAQCIPSTFADYHCDGTSWDIYDPVANIAASINYCINFYHVAQDGSDLGQKVQQADSTRGPHGYMVTQVE